MAIKLTFLGSLDSVNRAVQFREPANHLTEMPFAVSQAIEAFVTKITMDDEVIPLKVAEVHARVSNAARDMAGYNDSHPAGGDDTSRNLERVLGRYAEDLKAEMADEAGEQS